MKKEFLVSGKQFFITETMPLVAGDSNCYELVFYAPCYLDDSVFSVTATRSDGETFTAMGTVSGKTARYVLDNSMYAVPGKLKIRTTITAQDKTEITANEITFDVIEGTNSDEAVKADTNYPILTQLILKFQEMAEAVPEAKTVIEKAENAAENAETKAIFAESAAEEAKTAAEGASSVAEKGQWLLDKAEGLAASLPPAFSEEDEGKILHLARSTAVCELVSASRTYTSDDMVITDAGLIDEETAFIDVSTAELTDIGITEPSDERCAFGFQLIPDSFDYTTDYDITVESVNEADNAWRMLFPASYCEPFAENNIQSAEDLFSIFETVQFNTDYPRACVAPVWGECDDVLPPAFIDESIISPAIKLAKEYTDQKIAFTVTVIEHEFGQSSRIDLDGMTDGVKQFEFTAKSDFSDNECGIHLYNFPEDGSIEQAVGEYTLPAMSKGDKIVFDAYHELAIMYRAAQPDIPYMVLDATEFCVTLAGNDFNGITFQDMQAMNHEAEIEYYVSADYMVDSKIKSAIIDSWEDAV